MVGFTPACSAYAIRFLTGIVLGNGQLTRKRTLLLSGLRSRNWRWLTPVRVLIICFCWVSGFKRLQHPLCFDWPERNVLCCWHCQCLVCTLTATASTGADLAKQLSNSAARRPSHRTFCYGRDFYLVCSPCTTAPLSGALLYVAQSGDLLTSGVALYALAIGMGIPLILVAVFGNRLLPKAGAWMGKVKTAFGFILLAAPIFLLERANARNLGYGTLVCTGFTALLGSIMLKQLTFVAWKQSMPGIIGDSWIDYLSLNQLLNYWFNGSPQEQQWTIWVASAFARMWMKIRHWTESRTGKACAAGDFWLPIACMCDSRNLPPATLNKTEKISFCCKNRRHNAISHQDIEFHF